MSEKALYLLQFFPCSSYTPEYTDFTAWVRDCISLDPVLDSYLSTNKIPIKTCIVHHKDGESPRDPLPELHNCLGVIFSGCPNSFIPRMKELPNHTWLHPLIPFIRKAYLMRIPMFGVCFGHQLINYALGGTVQFLPMISYKQPEQKQEEQAQEEEEEKQKQEEPSNTSTTTNTTNTTDTSTTPIFEAGTRMVYIHPNAQYDTVFSFLYTSDTISDVPEKYTYLLLSTSTSSDNSTPKPPFIEYHTYPPVEGSKRMCVNLIHTATIGTLCSNTESSSTTQQYTQHAYTVASDYKHTTPYTRKDTLTEQQQHLVHPQNMTLQTLAEQPCANIIEQPVYVLSSNHLDAHQAISYGNNVYSTQYHPELKGDIIRLAMNKRKDQLLLQTHVLGEYAQTLDMVQDTPQAQRILTSFVKHVVVPVNNIQ